ncbi:MAG: hypothetical protein JWL85_110 [Candidatus Saccharibacteria bacterium]|nr:hypothetical protein [Candidatus Saccharibacteria bacterium]
MKKSVFIFVLLSAIASAVNYAAYPVLARLLPAGQYIDITVSLSLLTQMSTFLSSIIAITIGLSKSEEHDKAQSKIETLQSMLFKLFLAVTVAFLIVSPMIMSHIHVPLQFVLPISLMMLVSIPIAIISGSLTGRGLMVKLGILTATSATLQFAVATTVALITNSGLLAMLSMATAQIITIFIAYHIFRAEQLPKIGEAIWKRTLISEKKYMARLVTYTFISSLAIMALNLVQIADLLIVQAANNNDAKFYTDIYVISRIVFFAGMIFIWPFLSEINTTHHHLNRKPVLKVSAYFAVISLGAILGLYLFGNYITQLLFGINYNLGDIRTIGALSVLYKLSFLLITAIMLYFIVLRDYIATWITGGLTAAIIVFGLIARDGASTYSILVTLNIIAGIFAMISIISLLTRHIRPKA